MTATIPTTQELEAFAEEMMLWGAPFKTGGRAREGIDCLGVIIEVYRRCGFSVPDPLSGSRQEVLAHRIMDWFVKVDEPRDLDVFEPEGNDLHVGIVIGKMLLQMTNSGLVYKQHRMRGHGQHYRLKELAE